MGGHERSVRAGRRSDAAASKRELAVTRSRITVAFIAVTLVLAVAGPAALAQTGSAAVGASSWTRVSLPDGLVGLELHDVVAGGPGFIAVGGGFPEGSSDPAALILTSADGSAWQRVELEAEAATGQLRSVISVGGAWYMAVGGQCCPDVAGVWISVDGVAWQRMAESPQFFSSMMMDVTFTSAGFVVVGCQANLECGVGTVWTSADAVAWQYANPFLWIPNALVVTTTTFVAVGQTDLLGGRPVAASSADGTDWQPAALPDVVGALNGVATFESAVVAVGETRDPDTMQPTGFAITSGDGSEWQELDGAAVVGASYGDLVVAGTDLQVVGSLTRPDGTNAPASWAFTSGGPISGTFSPEGEDAWLRSVALGADGATLVTVGTVFGGAGPEPAIWVSQPST